MKTTTLHSRSLFGLLSLLLLVAALAMSQMARGQTTHTFDASGTFDVPANVPRVTVELVGGGGGGGGVTNNNNVSGGGGGGGSYTRGVVAITPPSVSVTVGAGGTVGAGSLNVRGGTGGFSSFLTLTAPGGQGGQANGTAAFGAGGTGGVGQVFYNGGNGAAGVGGGSGSSGGGGGGAGSDAAGGNATGATAGVGGAAITGGIAGGGGGAGWTSDNNAAGVAGIAPGGGGSGARNRTNSAIRTGGAGAPGLVVVSYFLWDGGGTDNVWSTGTNWATNDVAPANTWRNAIIPTGFNVIINSAVTVHSLDILGTSTVTIANGGSLTLDATHGELAVAAGAQLIIQDGGSLIHRTPGVQATMQRELSTRRWRTISSPVAAQAISGDWTPESPTHGYDFYGWDEPSQMWRNQKVPANNITNFVPGRGYLVSYEQTTATTRSFTGTLNQGNITVPVVRTLGTGQFFGANLIGNPYPSAIDWGGADRSEFADNFAYIYDPTYGGGGGYITRNGASTTLADRLIAPNQGFFVIRSTVGSGDFTFTNAMRVHGGTFLKSAAPNENLVFRLSRGEFYDEATLRTRAGTQTERDPFDAYKFFSFNQEAPQIFSQSSDEVWLAINSVPQVAHNQAYTLGIRAGLAGEHTLSIVGSGGAFDRYSYMLTDKVTGTQHNLSTGPYTFTATAGEYPDRFLITLAAHPLPVTFYVDMTPVAGTFTTVDIAGNFNNWGNPVQNMTHEGNNIYSFTTAATFTPGQVVEFKFRRNGTWDNPEPGANRTFTVVEGSNVYHAVYGVMVPAAITWANLQHPYGGVIILGSEFNVYARMYAQGLSGTQNDDALIPNLVAEIGFSTENTDPAEWTNWFPARFNDIANNQYTQPHNEEYGINLGQHITEAGTYYFASRFKLGMADYVYGGWSGGEWPGGIWDGTTNVSGVLEVKPVFEVTFNVDMSYMEDFDSGNDKVYISGSMFSPEWPDPGSSSDFEMTEDDNNYFTKTLTLPAGDYEYKFFVNDGWGIGDWDGISNRKFSITDSDLILNDIFGFVNFTGPGELLDPGNWAVAIPDGEEIYPVKINVLGLATVSDERTLHSLIISDVTPGTLFIDGAGALTVEGFIDNGATVSELEIQEGGTLIAPQPVRGTLGRSIPFGGWHFISSPASEMPILGSDFAPGDSPLPTNFDFFSFNEAVTDNLPWINLRASDGSPNTTDFSNFMPGLGYLVAYYNGYPDDGFKFGGMLNASNVNIPLTNLGNAPDLKGWNLIGNPFPSAILWNPGEAEGLAQAAAAIYNSSGENPGYDYVENGLLLPTQGFFVQTATADMFSFTPEMRRHTGSEEKAGDASELLVLKLSNSTNFDNTTIRLLSGTALTRDFRDAVKMFSFASHMPQLYSFTSDQVRVAINSIPAINTDSEFTLGLRIPASGEYKLSVGQINGAFQASPLFLRDLKTGTVQNLQQSPEFTFQANQGDDPARFVITFTQPTNVPTLGESLLSIYTWDKTLYLNFTQEAANRQLKVYDLSGRVVLSHKLDHGLRHSLQLNVDKGFYIVEVRSPEGINTQRVFVR